MANTTIRIKHSGSSGNVPSTLQPGELAINSSDGKLYYGNNTNHVIQLDTVTEPAGLDGEIQFNNLGSFGASNKLKYNTSTSTLSTEKISVNAHALIESTTVTTSGLSQITFDSWPSGTYRSAKYFVQITSGSEYNVIELSMTHDGANVFLTQYGEIKTTANSLGAFDASITTGTLSVLFTPTFSSTTVKASITLIPI
jgi:hypothetical protein